MNSPDVQNTKNGIIAGLAAYFIWGFFPLFFKTLTSVTPLEVLTHRIVWSAASLIIFVAATGAWGKVLTAARSLKILAALTVSTILISVNWFVFIHAVDVGRVLEASLGYYMTPLINILLGLIFLGERVNRVQTIAIALAVAGVGVKAWTLGQLPVISLILAASFGGYGLVRKKTGMDGVSALTVETLILAPFALAYALYVSKTGKASFLNGPLTIDLLLVSAGILTAIPLVLYGEAVRHLKLATVGILQYIVPTLQFMLAVFAFGEPFTLGHFITFLLIWTGLALYTYDAYRRSFG